MSIVLTLLVGVDTIGAMGLRLHRTVRLGRHAHLNISRHGISLSLGQPGATANTNRRGTMWTFGLPGTGISYRTRRRKRL